MRRLALGLTLIAAMWVWVAPVAGAPDGADEINPIPRDEQLVGPIYPAPPTPVTSQSEEMQLVGFSRESLAGNVGVLTMSLACQDAFPMSRICTVDEIRMSVNIPQALIVEGESAWTQNMSKANALFSQEPDLNCSGWMSNDPMDYGTTINLGGCYGGIKMERCNEERAVACCSKEVAVADD